jgi:3-hydroxyisobutyrate dehydrogenase-like beta-hydroxyacid dehydrogenase
MIGFLGLGHAGRPMASNLLKGGHALRVFDIDPEAMERVVALGAESAGSPAEVASFSEVVFLSLPHPSVSEQVVLGPSGVLEGAKPGTIVVELSTISPSLARRMSAAAAERGVSLLDAGVAGGIARAVTGELTIMAGGSEEAFQRVLPLFQLLASHIYHVGPSGSGSALKVVNNGISHAIWVAVCEGAAMAVRSGISPEVFFEVVSRSSGNSTPLHERFKNRVLSGNFEAGMTVDLAYKDSQLALQLASELNVPLFAMQSAHSAYEWARAEKLGPQDYASLITLWERLLGFEARETPEAKA